MFRRRAGWTWRRAGCAGFAEPFCPVCPGHRAAQSAASRPARTACAPPRNLPRSSSASPPPASRPQQCDGWRPCPIPAFVPAAAPVWRGDSGPASSPPPRSAAPAASSPARSVPPAPWSKSLEGFDDYIILILSATSLFCTVLYIPRLQEPPGCQ